MALCTVFYLLGCAMTSSKDKAFNEEKLLVSADFTYKVADTAAKLEKLNRLPQRKLLRHVRQGKVTYWKPSSVYIRRSDPRRTTPNP